MDRVSLVFSERVAALWKCCDGLCYDECPMRRQIPDCVWTRISRKRLIDFYIGTENGKWIYGFEDRGQTSGLMNMDELKNSPNQKNVVISSIIVFEKSSFTIVPIAAKLRPLDVDIEVLMKFVFFLSNEPYLKVSSESAKPFNTPEGTALLQWLEKMHFSRILISSYYTKYNRLLERQYSRRKPTRIEVLSIKNAKEFLELAALRIRKCIIVEPLSLYQLDAIVGRFLEDPGQFGDDYEIKCSFRNNETKLLLKGYERKNQCTTEDDLKFTFRGPNGGILTVENLF